MATQASPSPVPTAATPSRAAHSFPQRDSSEADVMPIARRTAKLLATGLRSALQPLASERLTVTPEQAIVDTHDSWLAAQGHSMGLAFYQLPPMKGRLALRLGHDLIAALVDAFFGGSISRATTRKTEYAPADLRLMHRIADSLVAPIGAAWGAFGSFRCLAAGLTDDPEEAKIARGDAPVLIQPFTLTFAGTTGFTIDIIYPIAMIQSARDEWCAAQGPEAVASDPVWRHELGGALAEVFVPVRSILARPTMSLPELANLKPGDIIPIPPAQNIPLIIGDRTFARGSLGEQNGLAAFRIDHIEKG
jgi:flagellar motor switch protein FliM